MLAAPHWVCSPAAQPSRQPCQPTTQPSPLTRRTQAGACRRRSRGGCTSRAPPASSGGTSGMSRRTWSRKRGRPARATRVTRRGNKVDSGEAGGQQPHAVGGRIELYLQSYTWPPCRGTQRCRKVEGKRSAAGLLAAGITVPVCVQARTHAHCSTAARTHGVSKHTWMRTPRPESKGPRGISASSPSTSLQTWGSHADRLVGTNSRAAGRRQLAMASATAACQQPLHNPCKAYATLRSEAG